MKHSKNEADIPTLLQTSRPSADEVFVQKLKQDLLTKAELILRGPNVSRLTLILINMRKYSLAYIAGLLLIAITGTLVSSRGLSPNEVLAKASENYTEVEGIYHEKVLHQRYESGILQEASLEESYYDNQGNFLWIVRDPDTEEILHVDLTQKSGDTGTRSYISPDGTNNSSAEELEKAHALENTSIYCAKVETNAEENTIYKAFLKIDASDPDNYLIDGTSEDLDAETEWESPSEKIQNNLDTLKQSKEYNYHVLIEEGQKYYIFEEALLPYDEARYVTYYFNADTYKLDKEVLSFLKEPTREDVSTYLLSERIDENQRDKIFDPSKFDVIEISMLEAGGPDTITEDGCYRNGEKLKDEDTQRILENAPSEAIKQWEDLFEEIIRSAEEKNSTQRITISTLGPTSTEENLISLISPTEGVLTQNFHAGHHGIDWTNETTADVLAAAEGTVVYVSNDGKWEGGYGDNIWIDHGNGFETHYAHLGEVNVSVGQRVESGEKIASMGRTGRVFGNTKPVLHFELKYNGVLLDPLLYIKQ